MKKLYLLAALLMASTAAHAGNAVSLQIGGHKSRQKPASACFCRQFRTVKSPIKSGLSGTYEAGRSKFLLLAAS
jgi:hypothetical protein